MQQNIDIFTSIRHNAYKLLCAQIGLTILIALLWLFFRSVDASWSAALGGAIWTLTNFVFIRKCFIMRATLNPHALLNRFYLAELTKFLISSLLIILCIKFLPLKIIPFLTGYITAVVTIVITPYVYNSH
jgi:F0F1-type ATP synthase assembly protein I